MNPASPPHRLLADGRLDLPEVTLVAASSKAVRATVRALKTCIAQVRFADAILFVEQAPAELDLAGIRIARTGRMESREDYSRFILKDLAGHIKTDFALCVQWDGYILNARNWSDEFLKFDYVGAPWPQFDDGHDVGNGGFSLRSRKLLSACLDNRIEDRGAEDISICRSGRPLLESEYGIKFADQHLARQFSYERTTAHGDEFGFHGVFNMAGTMPRAEYREIIASLEPGVLRRSDKIELLKGALLRGDLKTAQLLLTTRKLNGG